MEEMNGAVAWPLIVAMARAQKAKVEVEVEFCPPYPHSNAGRLMRLTYDPVTDRESHEWLDQ
jgi:hypothetical protein